MTDKSIKDTNKFDFCSSIPKYSDDQIKAILKKRRQYQKEAVELAIQEAIKRGLINSEQDLFAEEYNEKKEGLSFFPVIENEENRIKTQKSISRVLLIIGAVPAVWGVLEIFKGVFTEGVLLLLLGVIWVYSAFKLMKQIETGVLNLLLIMVAASVVYVIKLFLGMRGLVVMDYVIPIVFYSLILYCLLFLRRLK